MTKMVALFVRLLALTTAFVATSYIVDFSVVDNLYAISTIWIAFATIYFATQTQDRFLYLIIGILSTVLALGVYSFTSALHYGTEVFRVSGVIFGVIIAAQAFLRSDASVGPLMLLGVTSLSMGIIEVLVFHQDVQWGCFVVTVAAMIMAAIYGAVVFRHLLLKPVYWLFMIK